jgi:hypothetical protein
MARLTNTVHVTDEQGVSHAFGPADEVPEWAQALVTNPKAWAEPPQPGTHVSRLTEPVPAKKAPVKRASARRKAADGGTVHG